MLSVAASVLFTVNAKVATLSQPFAPTVVNVVPFTAPAIPFQV